MRFRVPNTLMFHRGSSRVCACVRLMTHAPLCATARTIDDHQRKRAALVPLPCFFSASSTAVRFQREFELVQAWNKLAAVHESQVKARNHHA